MINVLAPLDAAGLQAVLRSDGRVLIGPPGKLTAQVRTYIKDNLDHIVADLALRQASVVTSRWRDPVRDPRPDLPEDHELWLRLLTRARAIDADDPDGLYWSLLGCRCMSAELYVAPTTWRIRPRKGSEADYLEVKPYLLRNVDLLTPLLRSLAAESTNATNPTTEAQPR